MLSVSSLLIINSIMPTNYSIYESIARESFQNMENEIDSGRRPKTDGSEQLHGHPT